MSKEERERRMLSQVHATTATIADCPYDASMALAYNFGALRGMLQGMAGLGEFSEASLFSPEVTEAIKSLLVTIGE